MHWKKLKLKKMIYAIKTGKNALQIILADMPT